MDKYKAYVAKNPHLFKKVTTQTLKKRKQTQKGAGGASKRPRLGSSYDSQEEIDDEEEDEEDLDSEYGSIKKSKRTLKQFGKKIDAEFTNSRPLDQFGASHTYLEDEEDDEPAPRTRTHMDEDDENLQKKRKEADDRKRLLAQLK